MGIVKTLLGNAGVVVTASAAAAALPFFPSAIQFRCSHSFLPHICRGFTELSSPCFIIFFTLFLFQAALNVYFGVRICLKCGL